MKRTAFARKPPPPSLARIRQWTGALPSPRPVAARLVPVLRLVVPIEKENALQHAGYMATVRGFACARCGYSAKRSQFCHADQGKGQGIKTDCRLGWPGCGPHDGLPGCHWEIGTGARMSKEGRREFEAFAGASTRAEVEARGLWPARLPRWVE